MGKVEGLGGVFLKAKDPKALSDWYERILGVPFEGNSYVVLPFTGEDGTPSAAYNILSFSPMDSDYFKPSTSPAMLNLRVSGLKELLADLTSKGVTLVGDMVEGEYGSFGWILDPEGNKVELWEPPA